jgi:hypothetical protein
MAVAVVTIICIAMIVMGGMTLSQGIMTSTDAAAISTESISVREGEMMRTGLDTLRAAELSWGDYLRVTVQNSGQTKLAGFDKWDIIVSYEDAEGISYSTWLPYTTDAVPGNNEWTKDRIGLNGPVEYFEPGILNPGEEMVVLARLNPLPGPGTTGSVSLTTPNGIGSSVSLINPGYLRLTPQTESVSLSNTKYYELVEAAAADGPIMTAGAEFSAGETGRKLLYNTAQPARGARFIYALDGIAEIPAGEWTVSYRVMVDGGGPDFPSTDHDIRFSIDILVRQADGALRSAITANVAIAELEMSDKRVWVTLTGTYSFPGYSVTDKDDYLEIDFYGETRTAPDGVPGMLLISIDNSGLPVADQTRIEGS